MRRNRRLSPAVDSLEDRFPLSGTDGAPGSPIPPATMASPPPPPPLVYPGGEGISPALIDWYVQGPPPSDWIAPGDGGQDWTLPIPPAPIPGTAPTP